MPITEYPKPIESFRTLLTLGLNDSAIEMFERLYEKVENFDPYDFATRDHRHDDIHDHDGTYAYEDHEHEGYMLDNHSTALDSVEVGEIYSALSEVEKEVKALRNRIHELEGIELEKDPDPNE